MSRAGGPANSPGFLLWRATLRWQRDVTAALRPLELTHVQFVLLAAVWWLASGADVEVSLPSQRQVAGHANTDVMMTSQVLRGLEARGLVTRRQDPVDARVRRLDVTPRGAALAQGAIAVVEAADERFFSSVHDPGQLLAVLGQLSEGPRNPSKVAEHQAP